MNARARNAILVFSSLFIVLSTVAMLFYHGGYPGNIKAPRYIPQINFLSDLGLWHSYNNATQPVSNVLFLLALIAASAGIRIFFSVFLNPIRPGYRLGNTMSILASILTIVLGVLPQDVFYWPHRIVALLIFITMSLAFLALSRQVSRRRVALIGIFIAIYVLYAAFGPSPDISMPFREAQAIFQKVTIYVTFLFIIYLTVTSPNHA